MRSASQLARQRKLIFRDVKLALAANAKCNVSLDGAKGEGCARPRSWNQFKQQPLDLAWFMPHIVLGPVRGHDTQNTAPAQLDAAAVPRTEIEHGAGSAEGVPRIRQHARGPLTTMSQPSSNAQAIVSCHRLVEMQPQAPAADAAAATVVADAAVAAVAVVAVVAVVAGVSASALRGAAVLQGVLRCQAKAAAHRSANSLQRRRRCSAAARAQTLAAD